MEKMTILGTGAGVTFDIFNACLALQDGDGNNFLVDTGGGSGVLRQLKHAGIDPLSVHDVFISHKHTDHSFGAIWIYRCVGMAMRNNAYEGDLNFYCCDEVARILREQVVTLLGPRQQQFLDKRIIIKTIDDGDHFRVGNYEIEAIDLKPRKDKQLGFKTILGNGKRFAFVGDEPLNEELQAEFRNYDWLIHEALCLESDTTEFKPQESGHSTVKAASQMAERLGIKNLLLWHTREYPEGRKKERFIAEAKEYYSGSVYAPDDLDEIEL